MLLPQLRQSQARQQIMQNHRSRYTKTRGMVTQRKFSQIDSRQINEEKELVIRHLNGGDEDMLGEFEELSFYHERYLALTKFLNSMKSDRGVIDVKESARIVELFQHDFESDRESRQMTEQKPMVKNSNFYEMTEQNQKVSFSKHNSSLINAGLSKAVFEFFDQKQHNNKNIHFKDLIDEQKLPNNTKSHMFKKRAAKPGYDLEIQKLLQQNKRLHLLLQKKSLQETELSEFQKKVLKDEKQMCMKRIEELEDEVQELSRYNYKLQEMQKEKQRKPFDTMIDASMRSDKNQIYPYNIPTRHNDLNLITEKNKHAKMMDKDHILLNMVSQIPPIEKKEEHSFDDELSKLQTHPKKETNNILDLLEERDDNPKLQQPQKAFESGEFRLQHTPPAHTHNNNSIENGARFDSFSLASTAYHNSELFLNASKNQIMMESLTATRNKVAFFKTSLIVAKDDHFQIAFKKSNLDHSYSKLRVIFYINNKTKQHVTANIDYELEDHYYSLKITEKLRNIPANQQSREVVEITLLPNAPDLNSVVDLHVVIGHKKYDLWLPMCFIMWSSSPQPGKPDKSEMGFMTIQPDRQFASYENLAKIVPMSRKSIINSDQSQAFLYGRSRFGCHEVKVTWWQRQLTIDANIKILQFLGFVMHHFK